MDFKTAMEHVRDGTATEEERRLVDSEVDKYLLITEHLDARWEREAPPMPEVLPELKQLRTKLRRRNAVLIFTCLLLVAAIAAAAAAYIAPRMEEKQQTQVQQQVQQEVAPQVQEQLEERAKALEEANAKYWDPTVHTYSARYSDLHLTMDCYAELHLFSFRNVHVGSPVQTDIGTYQIPVTIVKNGEYNPQYLEITLEKDVLTLPPELDDGLMQGMFGYMDSLPAEEGLVVITPDWVTEEIAQNYEYFTEKLAQLPDYFSVVADVTFPDFMDMEQFLAFYEQYSERLNIGWVGIRKGPGLGLCGMSPLTDLNGAENVEGYPYLQLNGFDDLTPENLEQHFMSLLRFAQDQLEKGRGIARYSDPDFYTDVLGFVKLYGVSTYGCRITTTPSVLLELLESGVINYTLVLDTFIP